MTHLFLSHLSKDNNNVQLVQQLFDYHSNGIQVIIASRYTHTELFAIQHAAACKQPMIVNKSASTQLPLF
jgi:hypothetical protein